MTGEIACHTVGDGVVHNLRPLRMYGPLHLVILVGLQVSLNGEMLSQYSDMHFTMCI